MPSVSAGYVDPQCIAATCFNYAKDWKLDAKELAAGKTIEEKEKIQNKKIRQADLKVAAYIALVLKIFKIALLYMAAIQLRVISTLYLKLYSIYFI